MTEVWTVIKSNKVFTYTCFSFPHELLMNKKVRVSLEVLNIFFMCTEPLMGSVHVCMLSRFSRVELFQDPIDCSPQVPLFMGFSRQEYLSRLSCLPPGNLPDSGIEPTSLPSPALVGVFFTTSATREAHGFWDGHKDLNSKSTLIPLITFMAVSFITFTGFIYWKNPQMSVKLSSMQYPFHTHSTCRTSLLMDSSEYKGIWSLWSSFHPYSQ